MSSTVVKTYWLESRQTIQLAVPIIFAQLSQMALNITDSVMIGRVGTVPLAASAFVNGIFSTFLIVGFGLLSGLSPLVSSARGRNETEECGHVLRAGVWVAFLYGAFVTALFFACVPFLHFLGQAPEVTKEAGPYFVIMGVSMVPIFIVQAFRQFSESLNFARPAMIIMVLSVLVNIFLNWIFIYGMGPLLAMGLTGAAWATLLTRTLAMIALVFYVITHDKYEPYRPKNWRRWPDVARVKHLFNLGFMGGLQFGFEIGCFALAAIFMGWMSADALAAHQVAISLVALSFMVVVGLSSASTIRVGYAVGRNDMIAARRVGLGAIIVSGLFMGGCAVLFIFGRKLWPTLFLKDPAVLKIASELVSIAAFFQIVDGVQAVSLGSLRGLLDLKWPTVMTFVAYWLVGIPACYYLGFTLKFGAHGIWYGLLVGLTVSAICLSTRFAYLTKRLASPQQP